MRTEKQIEASRLNGAKSRGPVTAEGKLASAANSAFSTGPRTPEGKARSARNAHKRQQLANSVALPAERNEEFLELLHDYRDALRPVGFIEERVVETITVSDWHRRRYWVVGMARVAHATVLQRESSDDFTRKFSQDYGATQTALAIGNLVDHGRTLEFFRRCDTSYSREYRNARKELKELQTDRRKQEQAILDDGGDSTDFECYVASEPPPEFAYTEKSSEQTEPERTDAGADIEATETSEKNPEQTEPSSGIDIPNALQPQTSVRGTTRGVTNKPTCRVPIWSVSSTVPFRGGGSSVPLTNPGHHRTPPCDSDNIDS